MISGGHHLPPWIIILCDEIMLPSALKQSVMLLSNKAEVEIQH